MTLLEKVNKTFSLNKAVIVGDSSETFLEDIIEIQNRFFHFKLENNLKRIAIYGVDEVHTSSLIIALDAMFESILLIPKETELSAAIDYCESINICKILVDTQVSDRSELFNINDLKDPSTDDNAINTCHTKWILMTSGTTGTPKLVEHNLHSLTNTIKPNKKYSDYNWGQLYSVYRFAGLQVLLNAVISGNSICVPKADIRLAHKIVFFEKTTVTHLSATPTIWRKLLMTSESKALKLKGITLGGEIVNQVVLDALSKAFSNARIVHIYASTESGAGFTVTDGKEGFPCSLMEKSDGKIELTISDKNTLKIKSNSAASRYLGNEELSIDGLGFIDTGDVIEQQGDRFIFKGRLNGSINVGGLKVHPEEVESILMSHPLVQIASVSSKSSSITGSLVIANVVLKHATENKRDVIKTIKNLCLNHLEPYKVPAIIKIVNNITMNANGKIIR